MLYLGQHAFQCIILISKISATNIKFQLVSFVIQNYFMKLNSDIKCTLNVFVVVVVENKGKYQK